MKHLCFTVSLTFSDISRDKMRRTFAKLLTVDLKLDDEDRYISDKITASFHWNHFIEIM